MCLNIADSLGLAHSSCTGCREPIPWWNNSKKAAFSLLSLWILHRLELPEQLSSLSREVGEDWLLCWGSCEITDFPVISLPPFRLARANFPVSTQQLIPLCQHKATERHTHMHQEAHTGSSSRFGVVGAPWHSAAATHSQLQEGAPSQLSISSALLSKA